MAFGMGVAVELSDIQNLANMLNNLTIDNIKISIAPPFEALK